MDCHLSTEVEPLGGCRRAVACARPPIRGAAAALERIVRDWCPRTGHQIVAIPAGVCPGVRRGARALLSRPVEPGGALQSRAAAGRVSTRTADLQYDWRAAVGARRAARRVL